MRCTEATSAGFGEIAAPVLDPHHDRRDQIAGAGRVIVEQAQHIALAELEAEFFMKLAQRRLRLGFAGVAAPARQRPLRANGRAGSPRAGSAGTPCPRRIAFGERDGDRGPLQRGRRLAGRRARERGAELCDIPPGGIVKWPDHPA